MSNRLNPLIRIRAFCLNLPGTTEVLQFGHPFFKVRDKPFAIYSHQSGQKLSIKVEKQSQPIFLADPRFRKTPYLARHGWISLALPPSPDWEELEELIEGSYLFVQSSLKKAKKKQK